MTDKEMQILFDDPSATFRPGSTVSARLVLNLNAPKTVKVVKAKVKGEAFVKWEEMKLSLTGCLKTVVYFASETYCNNKFILAEAGEMAAGTYTYPITCTLPEVLPTSYESPSKEGYIRYYIEAAMVFPGLKFTKKCTVPFKVIPQVDLNLIEIAKLPIQLEKGQAVGNCFCSKGTLSANVSGPCTGYTPGQTIPLTIHIDNSTKAGVVKANVLVKKIEVLTSSPGGRPRRRVHKKTVVKVDLADVAAHGTDTLRTDVLLPDVTPTTNPCGIINVYYKLAIYLPIEGACTTGLHLKAPLVIGTIPLNHAD